MHVYVDPFEHSMQGEEEEVSSTQWYPGKDCSVLVDVCGRTLWSGVIWDHGYSGN